MTTSSLRDTSFVFTLTEQTDADGVAGFYAPHALTLIGYSVFGTITGTPSAADIDIQGDGTDVLTAVDISTNGYFDFATLPTVSAGDAIEIDLNFTGGTTPNFDGNLTLYALKGA
jgi:hypothetical protein